MNECRFRMPESSQPKEAAYQIINDELMLDGTPRLNLASFVTTWMEPECEKIMMASMNKNYVDMDEYPVTTELQVLLIIIISMPCYYTDPTSSIYTKSILVLYRSPVLLITYICMIWIQDFGRG